jgi:hypothetical protein
MKPQCKPEDLQRTWRPAQTVDHRPQPQMLDLHQPWFALFHTAQQLLTSPPVQFAWTIL